MMMTTSSCGGNNDAYMMIKSGMGFAMAERFFLQFFEKKKSVTDDKIIFIIFNQTLKLKTEEQPDSGLNLYPSKNVA